MPTFIAFWNWMPDLNWTRTRFIDRVNRMGAAVRVANAARQTRLGEPTDPWIFVSPEYTFSAPEPDNHPVDDHKAAIQVSTELEERLLEGMRLLTNHYAKLLLAPGTIAVEEHSRIPPKRVRNTSHAYYGGEPVWRVNKATNLGELSTNDMRYKRRIFKPGLGYDVGKVEERTYGAEICRDSTHGGMLKRRVHRHIVLAAGAGFKDVTNQATELLIIADWGAPTVHDFRSGGPDEIKPYATDETQGTSLQYYVMN
jgi:hypothetical protein